MSYRKLEKTLGESSGECKFARRAKSEPYQVKAPHEDLDKQIVSIDISRSDDAKKVLLIITATPGGFKYLANVCRVLRGEAINFGHSDKGTDEYVERYEIIKKDEPAVTVLTPDPGNLIYHLSVFNMVGQKELKAINKFFGRQLKLQDKAQSKEQLDEAPKPLLLIITIKCHIATP